MKSEKIQFFVVVFLVIVVLCFVVSGVYQAWYKQVPMGVALPFVSQSKLDVNIVYEKKEKGLISILVVPYKHSSGYTVGLGFNLPLKHIDPGSIVMVDSNKDEPFVVYVRRSP